MTAICRNNVRRPYQPEKPGKELFLLANSWQLFDEVVFIIKRNLAANILNGFLAGLPKFFLLFIIFTGDLKDPSAVVILATLHQLFWRPIAWQAIGTSFLAGFPDKRTRQLGKPGYNVIQIFFQLFFGLFEKRSKIKLQDENSITWTHYGRLFFANLATAMPFTGILALSILSHFRQIRIDGFEWFALAIWLVIWCFALSLLPNILLQGKKADKAPASSAGSFGTVFWLSLRFGFVLAMLYLVAISSSITLMELFGIPFRNGLGSLNSEWLMICFVIAADCLIDPFIIGFKLLLTRLGMENS